MLPIKKYEGEDISVHIDNGEYVFMFHNSGTKQTISMDYMVNLILNNPKGVNILKFSKEHVIPFFLAKDFLNHVARQIKAVSC